MDEKNIVCISSLKDYQNFNKYLHEVRENLSFYDYRDEFNITVEYSELDMFAISVLKISLYVIVIIMALSGNLFVMIVIGFNDFMKNSTNFFIFNLAICDLAILFSCVWVQILSTLNEFWILGKTLCKLNSFLQMVSVTASVLTLSLIVCDRYIGVIYPLKSRLQISRKKSVWLISAVWLISIVVSIPTYLFRTYTERKWSDFTETHCDDNGWPIKLVKENSELGCIIKITQPLKQLYFTAVIVVLFFLPILAMSIAYFKIINKLWNDQVIGEYVSTNLEIIIRRRQRVIKMFIIIMATFFICWLPLKSMLLYMQYTSSFPKWWVHLEWACYFMAYCNTAINPFLYAGLSQNYKKGLRKLMDRLFKSSNEFEFRYTKSIKLRTITAVTSTRTYKPKTSTSYNLENII